MTGIAVVASGHDAKFAEEVRAGLLGAKPDVLVSSSLPGGSDTYVVLVWGAALEAEHSIDVQRLIGLWSEGLLLVVRRDATPLPLGLRDLPSLAPAATAADVCAAVPGAKATKPQSSRLTAGIGLTALISIALLGGGAWYFLTVEQRAKQSELAAMLESAVKASEDLRQAQSKQLEALKALEQARAAEEAARKSGDLAKLKEAQEAAKRAEAEAATRAEAVKQREAAAKKSVDDTKKAQDAAKQASTDKAKEPAKATETVAVQTPAAAPAPAAATSAPAPSTTAPQKAAKAVSQHANVPCEQLPSRSAREGCIDERVASERLAKAKAATKSEATAVASAAPAAAPSAKMQSDSAALYEQALAMENGGDVKGAIRVYRRAARGGSGKAAKRLGEIFDKGVPGVSRDYAESLQWYETARQLGETVETAGSRDVPSIAVKSPEVEAAPTASLPTSAKPEIVVAARSATVPASPPAPMPESVKSESAPASVPAMSAPKPAPPKAAVSVREPAAPKAAETPPPFSVETPPASVKSAAPAQAPRPAPPLETKNETEPSHAWIIVLGLLALGAMLLWRRLRYRPIPEPSPPKVARPAPLPPADGAMLFVSYSHKDRPRVEPIISVIEEMGRRVWMDRTDITGQTGWAGQIVRAIRESRAVILMASPNSYASDQVVRELYLAMNHKKTIVPIEIEPAELPDELQYILAPFQHHRLSGGETREVIGRALAAV